MGMGEEIFIMPEGIFKDMLANGLNAPQLPVVKGVL
jgi:hypothetical protein